MRWTKILFHKLQYAHVAVNQAFTLHSNCEESSSNHWFKRLSRLGGLLLSIASMIHTSRTTSAFKNKGRRVNKRTLLRTVEALAYIRNELSASLVLQRERLEVVVGQQDLVDQVLRALHRLETLMP